MVLLDWEGYDQFLLLYWPVHPLVACLFWLLKIFNKLKDSSILGFIIILLVYSNMMGWGDKNSRPLVNFKWFLLSWLKIWHYIFLDSDRVSVLPCTPFISVAAATSAALKSKNRKKTSDGRFGRFCWFIFIICTSMRSGLKYEPH